MPLQAESRLETSRPELRGFPPGSLPTRCGPLVPADAPWPEEPGRRAAVLLLFIPPDAGSSTARLVFTRRSALVRSHRGQVGLAGGRADPEDATPADTALRELGEELGVDPGQVVILGALPPVTSLDGSPVHTIIGAAPLALGSFVPAPAEVDAVFADPWTSFVPGASREFRFNILGRWRESRVFEGGSAPVWGLTAQILQAAALAP